MPPFRIPFSSRKPATPNGLVTANDENTRPNSHGSGVSSPYRERPSLALGIKETRVEPNEFKLSSVDDSGQYLPPSPIEKKSFWQKSPPTSHGSRKLLSENEPFSISRESFESYRRSFDVTGRSPIIHSDSFTSRSSLDSRASRLLPRPAINGHTYEKPMQSAEEPGFEDITLNDDATRVQPRKKGFLSRFSDATGEPNNSSADAKSHHFHIPGRKRGQSGTGNELGSIDRPASKGQPEVVVQ